MRTTATDTWPTVAWDTDVEFRCGGEVVPVPLIIAVAGAEPLVVCGPVGWPSAMERYPSSIEFALAFAATATTAFLAEEGRDPAATRWVLVQDDCRVGVLNLGWRPAFAWLEPGPLLPPTVEIDWKPLKSPYEVESFLRAQYGNAGHVALEIARNLGRRWALR